MPEVTCFKPAGIPVDFTKEVRLSVEEVEAVRLKDLEGLEQAAAARHMNISRATLQHVLRSARRKIALGLTCGYAIRIEGGVYTLTWLRLECKSGHCWQAPVEGDNQESMICPSCKRPGTPIGIGETQ